MKRRQDIGAAIDVGSNSIHLLVAKVGTPTATARRGLTVLDDRSQLLGLGEVVDRQARITLEKRRQILTTVAEYLVIARANKADHLTLLGTEPLRRAANGPDVAAEVSAVTAVALHIISVRTEALLTFVGVTGGLAPAEPLIVVDIGGGSTEVSVYTPGKPLTTVPLAIGSARLTRGTVEHDPPTKAEMDRLQRAAVIAAKELPALHWPPGQRPRAIFVGGTATNLARLGLLTRAGLAEDRRTLANMTSAQVVEHFGVRPQRAVQLAAGGAIVDALLDRAGLDEAQVSDTSLRDGAIIAMARFGDAWPDRLTELFG
ncbi:MAG: exopolyphosphatase / guanosine-5-triphosphate,3-diphosphate pyrophosphatase [Chloroflexota bacterium]|nr:exopolyphosphatase / guanosine-5-triphosphate,3-diphosphate pyrophosphatase [Chloroflexota bacterium]